MSGFYGTRCTEVRHLERFPAASLDLHTLRIMLHGLREWEKDFDRVCATIEDEALRASYRREFAEQSDEVALCIARINNVLHKKSAEQSDVVALCIERIKVLRKKKKAPLG